MNIQLSDHFNCRRLLRFTLPSIVMMIFTSVYGVVDGFFVSNFVGKTSFAAVNFIMPFLMILGAVGFMFGAGGGALIAKTMGEGRHEKAQKLFSLFVYVTVICGIVIAVLGSIFIRPIAAFLGAEGTMLDALFVAVLPWGLVGAAAATAVSQCLGGVIPLIYFGSRNTSLLRLRKWEMDGRALLKACTNGSSELMSNISMSIVSMLYNSQLIRYAGEDGIAAYGILMYVNFVFLAVFIGYSTGTAPIMGYHYGAGNHRELKSLRKKSFLLIVICSGGMFMLAELLAKPLGGIFVGYDQKLLDLTVRAFTIYSFSFLFAGIAIFGSSFFTALNDGLTSAVISFLRTLVFQAAAVLLFPLYFGIDGIWLSIVAAEWMAMLVTLMFIVGKRKKYRY